MFSFGSSSLERLQECHEDLQKIARLAISKSDIDFGISEGYRSVERQKQLYTEGKSKIDGINKLGKHNYNPSMAIDIYIYHPNIEIRRKLAYDKIHLSYIAGIFRACSEELKSKGEISHSIRWGGNFNMNNELAEESFLDMPHFELV